MSFLSDKKNPKPFELFPSVLYRKPFPETLFDAVKRRKRIDIQGFLKFIENLREIIDEMSETSTDDSLFDFSDDDFDPFDPFDQDFIDSVFTDAEEMRRQRKEFNERRRILFGEKTESFPKELFKKQLKIESPKKEEKITLEKLEEEMKQQIEKHRQNIVKNIKNMKLRKLQESKSEILTDIKNTVDDLHLNMLVDNSRHPKVNDIMELTSSIIVFLAGSSSFRSVSRIFRSLGLERKINSILTFSENRLQSGTFSDEDISIIETFLPIKNLQLKKIQDIIKNIEKIENE